MERGGCPLRGEYSAFVFIAGLGVLFVTALTSQEWRRTSREAEGAS